MKNERNNDKTDYEVNDMEIKELRIKAKMTQKAFSEYFGIPKRTIEDWEQGRRTPPPYVVELIAYKIEKEGL